MTQREFLEILEVAERLKCNTRHCETSTGRRESVAEHSWRIALMAMLLREEFPDVNTDRVVRMCLIHDLGEAFTGDVPSFNKTAEDEKNEADAYAAWVGAMPPEVGGEFAALLAEMDALETPEAKLYKALDKLEALIQHNESALESWLPLEYDLQKTYAWENVRFSSWLTGLRQLVLEETERKIAAGEGKKR